SDDSALGPSCDAGVRDPDAIMEADDGDSASGDEQVSCPTQPTSSTVNNDDLPDALPYLVQIQSLVGKVLDFERRRDDRDRLARTQVKERSDGSTWKSDKVFANGVEVAQADSAAQITWILASPCINELARRLGLPEPGNLTQIEVMLVAKVHIQLQAWKVSSQHTK
ncbi:hypothetical protein I350_04578, partial [Cryptococcus amylolentus CBS 6273]